MFDPNSLLTTTELTIPRTPAELARWVEHKCCLFAECPEAKEWVLLRQRLSKKFHEEVYPLYRFVSRLYTGRADIQCIPNLDNRDFDAMIVDHSTSPPAALKVEITRANAGYDEHLRMKYFVEHGYVNAAGKVSSSGTKHRGHEIYVEDEAFECTGLLKQTCSLIQAAVARKSRKPNTPQKYGPGHVLLVAFDEWYVVHSAQDMVDIKDFVEKHVLTLPLNFAALYVVGLSGKTFLPFSLSQIQGGSVAVRQPPP
jgi:hypothetical protein